MTSNAASRMPAIFIGHGTPLNALRVNRWTEGWRQLGRQLARPQSILAISGHWCTRGTHVTAMARPPTIPLLYVVGAGGDDPASIELDGIERGALSMLSVLSGWKKQQNVEPIIADARV